MFSLRDSPFYIIFRVLKGTAIMTAQEIRTQGRQIKSWEVADGSWYTYYHQIWEVGDKYYQITDYRGNTFGCTMSRYDEVTEVEKPEPLPTHIGMIIGQWKGEAFISAQRQGTPEELTEWAVEYIRKKGVDYNGRDYQMTLKVIPLNFL